ncbi:general stress protein [Homoserinibacter sp. GY 40078]|uniref:general stress protein n=1 Tax=Homoserinibacter sp. GY 40078 TaxID=2603275 RepID=UPI0011C90B88|nr:general stress protein [Homoserinibacter sp. GY 40078]TXK19612.1 iron ABC transporter permease [Homoserinibacter sp. GY 40078]
MSTPSPFARRGAPMTVPQGDVLGTYDSYPEAQQVVDRLAKADFPIAKLAIVGNGLTSVEIVTRKRSWNRAALSGVLSGAWLGIFIGLFFSLLSPTFTWQLFAAAVFIGAAFGLFLQLASYAVARRNRDFESTTQVLAANYQIILEPGHLARAQELLSRTP